MSRTRAIKRFQQNAQHESQNGGQAMLMCSLTAFCDACFCCLGSFVIGNIQPPRWDVCFTDEDTTWHSLSFGLHKCSRNSDKRGVFSICGRVTLYLNSNGLSRFKGHVFKPARELYLNHGSWFTITVLCISALQHRSYYLFTPHPHRRCTVEIKSCLKLLIIPLHGAQQLTLSVESRALN